MDTDVRFVVKTFKTNCVVMGWVKIQEAGKAIFARRRVLKTDIALWSGLAEPLESF